MAMLATLLLVVLTALPQGLAVRYIGGDAEGDNASQGRWSRPPDFGILYKKSENKCVNDEDHGNPKNTTVEGCARSCSGKEPCQAFEFGAPWVSRGLKIGHCQRKKSRNWLNCNGAAKDVTLYEKPFYHRILKGCVNGANIAEYSGESGKDEEECKEICLLNPACKAFERGADGLCRLKSSSDETGCENPELILYVKQAGDVMMAARARKYEESRKCIKSGTDLFTFSGQTFSQCKAICNSMNTCDSFGLVNCDDHLGWFKKCDCVPSRNLITTDSCQDSAAGAYRPANGYDTLVYPWGRDVEFNNVYPEQYLIGGDQLARP